MNAKFLNPSNYFSAAELEACAIAGREPTFKILAVALEDVEDQNNRTKKKGSLTLEGADKPWLCNVTNARCLVAMFGEETDRWLGKRVTLHPERVMAFGEWTLGVRVSGSPDITAPVSVRIKLRKKKEQILTMKPTGTATAKPSPPKPPPGPYDEMWRDWKAAGFKDPTEFKTAVREATGKGTGWVADDVFKFAEMLRVRVASANGVDAPPPIEEPAPV